MEDCFSHNNLPIRVAGQIQHKYRNSLYFRYKNIFVHRKCTKIFYTNKFYNKIFPTLVGSVLHTSTSRIAAAHTSRYTWPLTQQAISFSPAITSAHGVISSINAHHTRLVKLFSFNLVCPKIILREYFLRNFNRRKKKANYGIVRYSSNIHSTTA